jgi:hypothetical protein
MSTNVKRIWFYQIFQGWFNPRTNKFEFGPNPHGIWYNSIGDEVEHACKLYNHLEEITHDLLVKKISDFQRLKDEATFALLVKVLPHTFTMVDDIYNFGKLNAILHEVNIGQHVPLMQ